MFILVYEKTYPLQTMLGLRQGRVNIWIHCLMPILQKTLATMGMTPERVQDGGCDLVIDGTERRRQRPQNANTQREHYSGKKAHTAKNLVLVNTHSQKVVYLSAAQPGKKHDKTLADQAAIGYPPQTTLGKDSRFQGYEPLAVMTWQPKKKPKGQQLSGADKYWNAVLAPARIGVEHTLSGVKRCHIVKDVFRKRSFRVEQKIM